MSASVDSHSLTGSCAQKSAAVILRFTIIVAIVQLCCVHKPAAAHFVEYLWFCMEECRADMG